MPESSNATEKSRASSADGGVNPSPSVLFAAPAVGEPTDALIRAAVLSAALTQDLTVLRVLALLHRSTPERLARERSIINKTLTWCDRALTPRLKERRIMTRAGDYLSVVAETARSIRATLVVVPEVRGQTGRSVCQLAFESQLPVLLARQAGESNTIVAASDLTSPEFPVLRTGAALSEHLQARVLFVHNIVTRPIASPIGPVVTDAMESAGQAPILERLDDLRIAAGTFEVDSENFVTTRPSPAEAVLMVSRREHADVMVIGARATTRHPAPAEATVAEKVIDDGICSVLVVPLRVGRATSSIGSHQCMPRF